jgi:O-antigen ligase
VRRIAYWLSIFLIFIIPWEDSISILTIGSIARLVGFVAAAFWAGAMLLEGRFRKPHLFHALVLLFFLWNFITIFWSLDIESTMQRIKTYSQVFLLLLLYWEVFQKPEHLKAGLQSYIFGGYILIISTIYNYLTGNAAVVYEGRYSATGVNANELSLVLIIGLPIAMYLFLGAGSRKEARTLKIINLAFIPLAIYSVILSGSRTSLIAIIPFGLYLIGTQQIGFLRKAVISIVFLISTAVLIPYVPQSVISRLGTIGSSIGEGDLGGRLNLWEAGIEVLAEHPVLGIGSGGAISSIGSAVHNTFISIAVETGLIGLLFFCFILGNVLYQVLHLPYGSSGLWLAILTIWLIGVLSLSWEFRKLTWLILSFVIIEGSFFEAVVAPRASLSFSKTASKAEAIYRLSHN